jgi:hypothetical protein
VNGVADVIENRIERRVVHGVMYRVVNILVNGVVNRAVTRVVQRFGNIVVEYFVRPISYSFCNPFYPNQIALVKMPHLVVI